MDSLRELYQDVILDHHRKPRNRREMADAVSYTHLTLPTKRIV